MFSVRDIMRSDVVTTRVDDSARSLARLLSDSEISGAPVLDSNGKVVGVASSTDLVRLAADESDVNFTTVSLRIDDELDDEISKSIEQHKGKDESVPEPDSKNMTDEQIKRRKTHIGDISRSKSVISMPDFNEDDNGIGFMDAPPPPPPDS